MVFDLGGTKIGVSYLDVPPTAGPGLPGRPQARRHLENVMEEDIERCARGSTLILVMPHWGKEYIATPEPQQVDLAHTAIDAGADLVVGGHAHWPKGSKCTRESRSSTAS